MDPQTQQALQALYATLQQHQQAINQHQQALYFLFGEINKIKQRLGIPTSEVAIAEKIEFKLPDNWQSLTEQQNNV
ncbi:hypothetical protein [Segetibacter aerophilus]|nr:hypothetical protein [Segetibacter aerophilus]